MAQQANPFWVVGEIVRLFLAAGCEIRTAETTVRINDGDCENVRYLILPSTNTFVALIDLDDDQQVSEIDVAYWERRLGVRIGRP